MPLLSWFNRDADLTRAALAPYRLLEPVAKLSHGEEDSPNMLIEGDNLEALKALLPYYGGQVKCIFIDPPYNTQSAVSEHYDDNIEHSQWLSMMYPRLELLKELLAEDGSIWITLDDNEAHYMRVIADEVFGRKNFVANVVWQKAYTANQTAQHISNTHDHVLVYAKSIENLVIGKVGRTEQQKATFKNADNDPRGPWKAENLSAGKFYAAGQFEITGPTGLKFRPPANRYWRCNEAQYERWLADGRITFGLKGTGRPMLKKFLEEMSDGLTPMTWWPHEVYGSNKEASIHLKALFEGVENVFSTPKPEKLIKGILDIATKEGDLVLDSFLGSGTTAAVAHKMGRRWIGVEIGEHARTFCAPRLVKVIDGHDAGGITSLVGWGGGGGYRFYKLGVPVFDEDGHIREGIRFEHLAAHVWFAETGTARSTRAPKTAFLGEHHGVGYYLLFNGILGDESKTGGNVLTKRVLRGLETFDGPKVIYGESCDLPKERLEELQITFKQTPYDIKAR
ncbi:site-specific DNA-methyltransferase [Stenotrophomonas sepilia]|uniref:site-specific DNA-methyltransferase n=1 Tax=Stenotrophomonas sepilia TaxID=2860290 RepID=UPI002E75F98F|nr:site-specific DNA-methyltransferase [Stenotrophomonas sepilia]